MSENEETLRRVAQFRFSIELFRRNYDELITFLDYFCAPVVAFSYSPVEERWLWHEAMKEINCLLHNFVAAAQSLVDHTRVLHQHVYAPINAIPDYSEEVKRRFSEDRLVQFVIKLRQMAQHYRLPSLNHYTNMADLHGGIVGSVTIALRLRSADLLSFDGWNAPAREYIKAAGETVNVRTVITDYNERITDFYTWFSERQREVHGVAAERYYKSLMHGGRFNRHEVAELEKGIAALEQKPRAEITFADIETAFNPVHSILDNRRLMLCRYDGRVWIEKALAAARSRFELPEALESRIRALVAPPPAL